MMQGICNLCIPCVAGLDAPASLKSASVVQEDVDYEDSDEPKS